MKFITVSELRANATRIVAELENSGEEVIVTKNGKPVVLMRSVSEDEFERAYLCVRGGLELYLKQRLEGAIDPGQPEM